MANVVRLVNGGTIQVRTGVLQGIGPQGPRGVQGLQGPQGEQGPLGETGPMGAIFQQYSKTSINGNNPVVANTDTAIGFGSNQTDELGAFANTALCTLVSAGDYLLSVWLRFDDAAAGGRDVWFASAGSIVARTSRQSVAGGYFYVDLSYPFRAAGGETINTLVRSSAATGISAGTWTVNRIGAGPPGPVGPAGPQGPVGATGVQGIQGVPGVASAGFTKYSDLMPH